MPSNSTQITPPRVPLTDERTGAVSREWYRWFYNLYTITGEGLGITPVINGGTGLGTIPTNGQLLIGNGTGYTLNTLTPSSGITVTNAIGTITIANSGVLSNVAGTGISVSGATGNVTISNTGVLSFSGGSTGLTPATATTGAVTLAGTLGVANGGTNGSDTPTAGAVAYGTGTAYGFTAVGTSGQVLTSAGAGVPTWTTNASGDVSGPGLSTDNAVARFDGTTGKLIQNSVTTIDDTGAATGFTTFAASTSVTTPIVQASNSAGLSLKNASGTTQMSVGAGGGDNMSINVSTNLNGTNAQIDISPTGTGHVHIKPSGTGSIEVAPTNVGTINNMTIGATTPAAGSFTSVTNSALTSGRVTFASTGGLLADSANLFWNNSTNRLGIGVASPARTLDVSAATAIAFLTSSTGTNGVYYGASNTGGGFYLGRENSAGTTFGSSAYASVVWSEGAYPLVFGVNNNERARFDTDGNLQMSDGAVIKYAPAPAGVNSAETLTNAKIQGQIISTTGTTYTVTMPLGTTLETLAPWGTTNISYDFYVVNTATGIITMAVNTGVTSLGLLTIAAATSAQFRIRRTAANTFVLYRLG